MLTRDKELSTGLVFTNFIVPRMLYALINSQRRI